MGVPKFFRYISERYPCLSEQAREEKIPEFDNLYLDMNGIIHACSHPDDANVHFRITEDEMYRDIFNYIDKLFFLIKPQKLFFLAVDGVAPRAKMNQQRSRRFRTAKDAEILERLAQNRGEVLPETSRFDSNCITPGTVFMAKLQEALRYFIKMKISSNHLWRKCRVILSGHETPGEGEHKIMEYIRYLKLQPDYDPNTRHCLYGLDADLIILGLCTHEAHFSLLREEVNFGRKAKRVSVEETRFFLLHLGLLKEYLELEFQAIKNSENFDIEKIVDDWILMGFLVGNDFIPHLPHMHINTNALPLLYTAYIDIWPDLGGYINEGGELNLERLEKFMQILGKFDKEFFEERHADLKYLGSKKLGEANVEEYDFKEETMQNIDFDPDLNQLIKDSDMIFSEYPDIEISNIEEEFAAYKRDYYINKLKYNEVTDEVLAEQTECYITALQWILYYYYKGVPSWSWFYPHHYAPFASDVKDFKHLKIKFELGKPFLPFQQLLAVLPSASKELLPEAFRHLMVNSSSALLKYYPTEFETDLNGKRQEWEAVVLIPFIDEEELLREMEPCLKNLTEEEKGRNKHGPMLQYDYVKASQGSCNGVNSFKPLYNVFCCEKKIWRADISKKHGSIHSRKLRTFEKKYYLGFPTMKHLDFTGTLRKAKVKVFDYASRNDNMILIPEINPTRKDLREVAQNYLNKVVYIGWPHLIEAKVVAVSTRQEKIDETGNVMENDERVYDLHVKGISEHAMNRMGIDFQDMSVLVHTLTLLSREYVYSACKKMALTTNWNPIEVVYPAQGLVMNSLLQDIKDKEEKKVEEVFPKDSTIFMLGQPYSGCKGKVLDPYIVYDFNRLKVSITVLPVPDFTEAKRLHYELESQYVTMYQASFMLGISHNCLARITGSIFFVKGLRHNNVSENTPKINIGLRLKSPKNNEQVIGYTQRSGNTWLYSKKAIEIVRSYLDKFPKVFELISANQSKDIYFESELFPNKVGCDCISEITSWLKDQDHIKAERVPYGTKTVEKETLMSVISAIDKLKTLPVKNVTLQVKPHLILKPGSSLPNTYKRTLNLFDRVTVTKNTYQVPLGFEGTIIAIHPVVDPNPVRVECVKAVEMFYEILLDKELPEGQEMHGLAKGRIFKISENSLLKISREDGNNEENCKTIKEPIDRRTRNSNPIHSDLHFSDGKYKNANGEVVHNRADDKLVLPKKLLTNDIKNDHKTLQKTIYSVNEVTDENRLRDGSRKSKSIDNKLTNLYKPIDKCEKEQNYKLEFVQPPVPKPKEKSVQKDKKHIAIKKPSKLNGSFNCPDSTLPSAKENVQNIRVNHKIVPETDNKRTSSRLIENRVNNRDIREESKQLDKTEALRELLGINKKEREVGRMSKEVKISKINLPKPPSRWRDNAKVRSSTEPSRTQPSSYSGMHSNTAEISRQQPTTSVVMYSACAPVVNSPNSCYYYHNASHPPLSDNPQMYSSTSVQQPSMQQNSVNLDKVVKNGFIPLQVLKGVKIQPRKNERASFKNKSPKSESNAESNILITESDTKEISKVEKKRNPTKFRKPRIAARFDYYKSLPS